MIDISLQLSNKFNLLDDKIQAINLDQIEYSTFFQIYKICRIQMHSRLRNIYYLSQ